MRTLVVAMLLGQATVVTGYALAPGGDLRVLRQARMPLCAPTMALSVSVPKTSFHQDRKCTSSNTQQYDYVYTHVRTHAKSQCTRPAINPCTYVYASTFRQL